MHDNFLENWPFRTLFDTFEKYNESVYLVGGAVRDLLLGKRPSDWDFASSAEPERIAAILSAAFPRYPLILKGKRFGTIGIDLSAGTNDVSFEITAFRKEKGYADGRHPGDVAFQASIYEDVRRRDFTINGLWMDRNGVIFDTVGGLADLKQKKIRCIGRAAERFEEDRLRKWRCVRFAAQVGGQIENKTRRAIVDNPAGYGVSVERIQTELVKMLTGPNAAFALRELAGTGLWDDLLRRTGSTDLPAFSKAVVSKIDDVPRECSMRLAWLLQDAPAGAAQAFLKKLRFSNQTVRQVEWLSKFSELDCGDIVGFKKTLRQMGRPLFEKALDLQEMKGNRAENRTAYLRIVRSCEPITPSDLAIGGRDLAALGFRGRQIGDMLEKLLLWVYRVPEKNQREALIRRAGICLEQINNKGKR